MRAYSHCLIILIVLLATVTCRALAQNPIITNQFTADPSARVFEGKVYVYPSHDILARRRAGPCPAGFAWKTITFSLPKILSIGQTMALL